MSLLASWCCICGALRFTEPDQVHHPERRYELCGHLWLSVGTFVPDDERKHLEAVVSLLGAGGEAPREARSARSEVPSVARHPHPSVTTAELPAPRPGPLPPQPSSGRGEGTPTSAVVRSRDDVLEERCPRCERATWHVVTRVRCTECGEAS